MHASTDQNQLTFHTSSIRYKNPVWVGGIEKPVTRLDREGVVGTSFIIHVPPSYE